MLDFETHIERHAEYTRDRRSKIARYKAASWINPVRKLSLFGEAHPAADWPYTELAIIASLLCGIGTMAAGIFK